MRSRPRAAREARDPFIARAALLLSVSTASAAFGVYGLLRGIAGRTDILEPWTLLGWTIVPSLLLFALFLGAIVFLLGGSSRAHLVLLEVLLVGSWGFVLSGHALAREANLAFDGRPPRLVHVSGIDTEHVVRRGKRGRRTHRYYVHVDDWRASGAPTLRLEIDSATYGRLPDGGDATLYVRPGALGFEWIERIEPRADR